MSTFGETVFSKRPFIRWALSPFLLLCMVVMPLSVSEWNLRVVVIMGGLDLLGLLMLIGFWAPPRISSLAFRGAAFLLFAAYAAYLIAELVGDKPFKSSGGHGEASPLSALVGFVVIGYPALCYALLGRFTIRAEPPAEDEPDEEEGDDDGEEPEER